MKCTSKCTRKKITQKPAMRRIKCHLTFVKLFFSFFQPAKRSIRSSRTGIINFISVSENELAFSTINNEHSHAITQSTTRNKPAQRRHIFTQTRTKANFVALNEWKYFSVTRDAEVNYYKQCTQFHFCFSRLFNLDSRAAEKIQCNPDFQTMQIFLLIAYLFVIIEKYPIPHSGEKLAYGMT